MFMEGVLQPDDVSTAIRLAAQHEGTLTADSSGSILLGKSDFDSADMATAPL